MKCPKCGATGNRYKNIPVMYCCTYCTDVGFHYDNKGREYRYTEKGQLRRVEDDSVNQVEILKQNYTKESLILDLAKRSGSEISREYHVSPSTITALKKALEVTQDDVDVRKVELGIPSIEKPFKKNPEKHYTVVEKATGKVVNNCDEVGKEEIMQAEDAEEYELVEAQPKEKDETSNNDITYLLICDEVELKREFNNQDEMKNYIKINYTLEEASKLRIFELIRKPINIQLTVDIGKAS